MKTEPTVVATFLQNVFLHNDSLTRFVFTDGGNYPTVELVMSMIGHTDGPTFNRNYSVEPLCLEGANLETFMKLCIQVVFFMAILLRRGRFLKNKF